ncbi:MAG: phenylacetic acid degradation protein [Acidobacteria bacterium]|nr:MAG: phenylacetic acid degradation protein [Acidobacteriota bacterium]
MPDTQWPRFEVFLIEDERKPAEHVGSVHAPDPEMALLNARDVFVRRPHCEGLWVAASGHVLFRTAEELARDPVSQNGHPGEERRYLVFGKPNHREPLALAACLSAQSPEEALAQALKESSAIESVLWAVVSEAELTRSDRNDRVSFFEPAATKNYKLHAEYPTARLMKEIRQK